MVSGVQPSGALHLGNYFGAVQKQLELARDENRKCFFFLADYHAMTSGVKGDELRRFTFNLALEYLALGLDPNRAILFRQSDIPEVHELLWCLGIHAAHGELLRGHAFKAAAQSGQRTTAGLLNYPLLMAADILLYSSPESPLEVPVGRDQEQHLEMTRTFMRSFKEVYGNLFPEPQTLLTESPLVLGLDGKKMSKSRRNTLPIFGGENDLRNAIGGMKKGKDTVTALVGMLGLFQTPADRTTLAEAVSNHTFECEGLKGELLHKFLEFFAAARVKRATFEKEPGTIEDILQAGAQQARAVARENIARVRKACGLQ